MGPCCKKGLVGVGLLVLVGVGAVVVGVMVHWRGRGCSLVKLMRRWGGPPFAGPTVDWAFPVR